MISRRRSKVWIYFQVEPDERYAKCNICQTRISRGGIGKTAGTTSLLNHLKFKHRRQYGDDVKSKQNSIDNNNNTFAHHTRLPSITVNSTIEYDDDVNDLLDRLVELYRLREAGKSIHKNEIYSILKDLES